MAILGTDIQNSDATAKDKEDPAVTKVATAETGQGERNPSPKSSPPSSVRVVSEPPVPEPDHQDIEFRTARTMSPKMSPGVLGEGNLYRTESPSALSSLPTPHTPAHHARVNFAVPSIQASTQRPHSSRSPARRPTMSQAGVAIVTASPSPHRQGTGLLISAPVTRSGTTDGDAQPAAPLPLEPLGPFDPQLKAAPTYERRFGGFPGPVTLAARGAERIAPRHFAALKRKLTIDSPGVYVPLADSNRVQGQSSAMDRARTEPLHSNVMRRRREGREDTIPRLDVPPDQTTGPSTILPPHLHSSHDAHVPSQFRFDRPTYFDDSSTGIFTDIGDGLRDTVRYLTDGILKVGRNSAFLNTDELTDEQLEELGGIEYRALRALTWILGLYYAGTQLTMFIIFSVYLSTTSKWDPIFEGQPRLVPKPWFSAFQAVSSYTGGGLTLVDQGMVPFASAFVMVLSQGWLIVAGSLGLPIFLRLIVWILSKIAPEEHKAPLQFLLDHPRRCYLYLFPSHQTWFLVFVFFSLTFIEWFGFLILDIGIPTVQAIPIDIRVLSGLFQSIAVRASGFAIVPLGSVAPAVKFMYMVMMYISAYPIAMSIRSTNVYEQRSLGVYEDVDDSPEDLDPDVDEGAAKLVKGPQGEVLFSKYLGMHIRRQLSYDLWWLALGLFLILIIERGQVMNPDSDSWFNQFTVMFELVSAYATVGLSLGIPTENFSLSGTFQPLSKFILCLVMLRGRHRDLPQAIDRAILLPHEFTRNRISPEGHHIIDGPSQEAGNAVSDAARVGRDEKVTEV